MKRLFMLLLIPMLLLTGCTIKQVDNKSIGSIVDSILNLKLNISNHVSKGYKYYIPSGLRVIDNSNYNEKLISSGIIYYLYIDVISYKYNKPEEYKGSEDIYYYKKLDYNNKYGYITVIKGDQFYYVEMVYNYAKIETYSLKRDLNTVIINASYILNSLMFNNKIIKTAEDDTGVSYNERKFKLFEPKSNTVNYLDYVKEYDVYEQTVDENLINIDNNGGTVEDIITQ